MKDRKKEESQSDSRSNPPSSRSSEGASTPQPMRGDENGDAGKKVSDEVLENAYRQALARFSHRPEVTAITVGNREVNGKETDEPAIKVHVEEKIDASALEASELLPEQIAGVRVDVVQARYAPQSLMYDDRIEDEQPETVASRQRRANPLRPGISVSHPTVTSGTLGAIVYDRSTGRPAILSNWHVLVGSRDARPGDPIVQPGTMFGGRAPQHTVAHLERFILGEDGDAAIAFLTNARQLDPRQFETNSLPVSARMARRDEVVQKSGATTGVTRGRVKEAGRFFIGYSVGRVGVDGFKIVPLVESNPKNEEISEGGDSGSLWISETGEAVGLHFAGEVNPLPNAEHAIACHLPQVLRRLNVSLAQPRPLPESADGEQMSSGMDASTISVMRRLTSAVERLSEVLEGNGKSPTRLESGNGNGAEAHGRPSVFNEICSLVGTSPGARVARETLQHLSADPDTLVARINDHFFSGLPYRLSKNMIEPGFTLRQVTGLVHEGLEECGVDRP